MRLVCPGCYEEYDTTQGAFDRPRHTCPECGLPLLRSEQNRKKLKCLTCAHRAIVPQGIWCTHRNCAATSELARSCRKYERRSRRKD